MFSIFFLSPLFVNRLHTDILIAETTMAVFVEVAANSLRTIECFLEGATCRAETVRFGVFARMIRRWRWRIVTREPTQTVIRCSATSMGRSRMSFFALVASLAGLDIDGKQKGGRENKNLG